MFCSFAYIVTLKPHRVLVTIADNLHVDYTLCCFAGTVSVFLQSSCCRHLFIPLSGLTHFSVELFSYLLITHASLVHSVLVSPLWTLAPRWYIAYIIIVTRSFSACPYFDKANKLKFLRLFTTFNVQFKNIFLHICRSFPTFSHVYT